jgi:hypothetical protein
MDKKELIKAMQTAIKQNDVEQAKMLIEEDINRLNMVTAFGP